MGSRILHELSQELAILLESGLGGDGLGGEQGRRIPVYLCHPLDPFEDQHDPAEGTFGILYMTRVVPDPSLRQNAIAGGGLHDVTLRPRLSRPPLWVRARYVFLVAGGDVESQLVAIASALQTLYDHSCVRIARDRDAAAEGEPLEETSRDGFDGGVTDGGRRDGGATGGDVNGRHDARASVVCPLQLVADAEGWRELGLPEHRLTLAFEATCPIPGSPLEPVERIQERGLKIEESTT